LLPSANSLTSLSYQLTGIFGPALGAGLVALGGTPGAFGLDSLSFFLSAACLAPLLRIALPRSTASGQSPLRDLGDGFREVAARTWLWLSIAFFGLINMVDAGPRNVALPFLIHDVLGLQVEALGAVSSAIAVGSVTAAVVLGRRTRLRRRGLLLYGGEIVMGSMLLSFGLAPSLPYLIGAALVYGVGFSVANLAWTNILQEKIPPERLGRVSSVDALGSFVFLPIGFGAAGILAERIGAANVFRVGGAVSLLLALAILLVPSIRRLD
jgi:MFS family permease